MKQPKCHIFAFGFHFNEVVAFGDVILSIITSSLDVNATKGKENLIISIHCSYKLSSIVFKCKHSPSPTSISITNTSPNDTSNAQ